MPTLIPVIITVDEHAPSEALNDLYLGLFNRSSTATTSLFQSTISCALTLARPDHIITVTPFEYGSIIREQFASMHAGLKEHVLLTPSIHNTVGCISLAAHHALAKFSNPVLWIIPVHQASYYARILKMGISYALQAAFEGYFVLFGMRAFKADLHYSYMLTGGPLSEHDHLQGVRMFVPHPSEHTLESIWQQPYCLVNSGNLLAAAQSWLYLISDDMLDGTLNAYANSTEGFYGRMANAAAFTSLPHQSLAKYLGLLAQKKTHPMTCYPLPADTSKHNGWYQLWQQSQTEDRGDPLQKFLHHIKHVA